MVSPDIHTLCLEVRAAADYRSVARCFSLSSFISLKYVYSWLIACYCTYSNHDMKVSFRELATGYMDIWRCIHLCALLFLLLQNICGLPYIFQATKRYDFYKIKYLFKSLRLLYLKKLLKMKVLHISLLSSYHEWKWVVKCKLRMRNEIK
jgi:hypothetical protein